jgi:O-methyltransferase involved in polyketide biosynthesis
MPIEHVSDTARWVAFYRAMETERPDAIFRDPFARQLAGPEGERIVRELPRGRASAWAMITRTAVFDEIILDLVQHRDVDLVLNLAAGLDARPWRLPLPPLAALGRRRSPRDARVQGQRTRRRNTGLSA